MKATRILLLALATIFTTATTAMAAPTWGIDTNDATLQIDAHGYADNGVNGGRPPLLPPGPFFEDLASANAGDFQSNAMASFFGQAPENFDLVGAVNVFGEDQGFNPDFRTSASAVGVIGINGIGTRTLDIYWRVNTANTQRDFHDLFFSDSFADLTAQIVTTIEGVAANTALTIDYDWEFAGTIFIDHEAVVEDPTTARGTLGFIDEQGTGPGGLFSELFAEGVSLGGVGSGSGSYNFTTSNTADPSFLTVDLDGRSDTFMNFPGEPPLGGTQLDLASSVFNGRLTLTLPVPEPTSLALLVLGGSLFWMARRETRG